MNIESNPNDEKISYQIPSRTILLPNEFSSTTKSISNSNLIFNKIQRTIPIDNNNRNILIHNQDNSFYLKKNSIDNTFEQILNDDNLNQQNNILSSSIKQPTFILPRFIDKSTFLNKHFSHQNISLSQITNDIEKSLQNNRISTLTQDYDSSPFKLFRDKIDNEYGTDTSAFDILPQNKIQHQYESLWKTKLTLKTILSMANRDEAKTLKDRKTIDYHMFLTNKLHKNSIFQYNDHLDRKSNINNKHSTLQQFNQQNYKENRILYKRLLNTMGLRKPLNIKKSESLTSIKHKTNIIQENTLSSFDDSIQYITNSENEKPLLITYQAIPISEFN